jgi:hypothetical protein
MKSQMVKKLSKNYLLPNLPGFRFKGHMLYHQDLQYLLRGFSFENSAFSQYTFTINVFVQPLYIPRNYLSFGFGERLGLLSKGRDIWWEYTETQEEKIMREILSIIIRDGKPYLEKRESLIDFVRQYHKSDKRTKENKHNREAICYTHALLGDFQRAKNQLDSFIRQISHEIRKYPDERWRTEIQNRAQLILDYLIDQKYENAVQQLNVWRKYTLSSLGINIET